MADETKTTTRDRPDQFVPGFGAIADAPDESNLAVRDRQTDQQTLYEWLETRGDPYAVSMWDRPPTLGERLQTAGRWVYLN